MQKKTKRPKNNYVLEASEVAELTGSSKSLVVKVRTADVSGVTTNGKKAKLILTIDAFAEQSKSLLIQEIKRVVNI